ncbi:LysR family transcriptional regulator [Nocardia sp. NPDC101769]|uniref:LysR family transcriptional regulator n=1 Tax=Nocardia sp. NPDC101769 TaxID=3364333 RepID=UPI003823F6B4
MTQPPMPPTDLDLRLVRCFTTVVEHRHFGRAAEALHLTQPALSRQIARLERQLGVRLLDRTPRGAQPTEAGTVFLALAAELLRAGDAAVARTRAAAAPSRLIVGFTSGLIITPAVRALRHLHPLADVHALHLDSTDARAALLEHRVDAAVARMPFPTDNLRVTTLYDEPRVLVVATGHRLAGKGSVTIDDIADEPLVRVRHADAVWAAFWRIDPRPDGRRAPDGPVVDDIEDRLELVADGRAITIAAAPTTRHLRPDLTSVPLAGVAPSRVVLATRAADRNRLLPGLRECVLAHLTGQ